MQNIQKKVLDLWTGFLFCACLEHEQHLVNVFVDHFHHVEGDFSVFFVFCTGLQVA